MSEQSLNILQHWLKTVVTERGGLSEKLDAAARQHGLHADEVVAQTRGLSAHERLAVYSSGYVLRLLECMREDFPVLRSFVGDSVFDAFARAYLITMPPNSPSLYDLGADFPRFLEETKPTHDRLEAKTMPIPERLDAEMMPLRKRLDAETIAMLDLPPELARLERARAEVMRARGTEDDPSAAEPLSFFAAFGEELTLQTTPCLRLLEMKFPLVDFLRRSDQGEHPEPPEPRESFVAVSRSNYRVHVEEISRWQFSFLRACAHPTPSYPAVQIAARETGRDTGQALADVALWLPVAFELGFLRPLPHLNIQEQSTR